MDYSSGRRQTGKSQAYRTTDIGYSKHVTVVVWAATSIGPRCAARRRHRLRTDSTRDAGGEVGLPAAKSVQARARSSGATSTRREICLAVRVACQRGCPTGSRVDREEIVGRCSWTHRIRTGPSSQRRQAWTERATCDVRCDCEAVRSADCTRCGSTCGCATAAPRVTPSFAIVSPAMARLIVDTNCEEFQALTLKAVSANGAGSTGPWRKGGGSQCRRAVRCLWCPASRIEPVKPGASAATTIRPMDRLTFSLSSQPAVRHSAPDSAPLRASRYARQASESVFPNPRREAARTPAQSK